MQVDPVDYLAVGGEGAEFRLIVPGERSLLTFLSCNLNFERLFSAVAQYLSVETRKSVDVRTLLMLRYIGAVLFSRDTPPNGDGVVC